ncbi:MAG TPA: DegV family protein [Anaerolineae bacterium]|nr:DegV family protein [Anaerolineae bacterium]HQH39592.1 DegV family protein [Anaerolineae bacterium]
MNTQPSIAVVTDSAAAIPAALLAQYHIEVVPIWVNMDKAAYRSGIDVGPAAFYAQLRANPDMAVFTSVPAIPTFLEAYQKQAQWAKSIISIHVAGTQSGTCSLAEVAGRESPVPVVVVDTQTTAMGQGFVALEAARAANEGMGMDEIVAQARAAAPNVGVVALLETISYVFKGGRLSSAAGMVGSLLKICPLVRVQNNRVSLIGQARRRSKGIAAIIEKVVAEVEDNPVHLAVHYAEDEAEGVYVLEELKKLLHCVETFLLRVPIELGVHAGPGSLGVAYYIERQTAGLSQQLGKLSGYAREAREAIRSHVPWSQKDDES